MGMNDANQVEPKVFEKSHSLEVNQHSFIEIQGKKEWT